MKNTALNGKPCTGNPHVRFDDEEVASAKQMRGPLLYDTKAIKIKKQAAILLAVSLSIPTLWAGTWYVDANNGNDEWDGSSSNHVSGLVGPKQTLCGALTNAAAKDVVYALPGRYDKGTYLRTSNNRLYRAIVDDVTLISTDGPERTFIVGALDPDVTATSTPYGCGPKAVSCVYMPSGGSVTGFTLCEGRTPDVTSQYGGAVVGSRLSGGAIVDCICSNNIAYRAGAVYNLDYVVRCRFHANRAVNWAGTCAVDGRYYVNCYFGADNKGDYHVHATGPGSPATYPKFLGCTSIANGSYGMVACGSAEKVIVANCACVGADMGGCRYLDSFLTMPSLHSKSSTNDNCRVLALGDLQFDLTGAPLKDHNIGIDAGTYESYSTNFPAALRDEIGLALGRGPRVQHGRIDAGAVEYDWCGDFSTALAPSGVKVLSASAGVFERNGSVVVPAGEELVVRVDGSVFRFATLVGTVTGAGVLEAYADDAEMPSDRLVAGDLLQTYETGSGQTLRLVMTGAGEATFSRIAATFFVDANNGNDAWDGSSSRHVSDLVGPKLTLCGALSNAPAQSVIRALPGRYDKGTYLRTSNNRLYRTVLDNVTLASTDGPEKTFIVGASDPDVVQESGVYGCGPKAISCVYMPNGGSLRGFTLCNGRASDSTSQQGGAIVGSRLSGNAIIDCICSNNIAYRGGAVQNVDYAIRCRFHANRAVGFVGACSIDGRYFINCFFDSSNKGSEDVRASTTSGKYMRLIGCTALSVNSKGIASSAGSETVVVNSVAVGPDQGNCTYVDSLLTATSLQGSSETNGNCRVLMAGDLVFTADGRPVLGSNAAIDAGFYESYAGYFPTGVFAGEIAPALGGVPRVLNGRIDAGAAEYDWRDDFSKALSRRYVTVVEAGPTVALNDSSGLELSDGDGLEIDWDVRSPGTCSFASSVMGEGTLSVRVNGLSATPASDGTFSFALPEGVSRVSVFFSGTGTSRIGEFVAPKRGSLLILR